MQRRGIASPDSSGGRLPAADRFLQAQYLTQLLTQLLALAFSQPTVGLSDGIGDAAAVERTGRGLHDTCILRKRCGQRRYDRSSQGIRHRIRQRLQPARWAVGKQRQDLDGLNLDRQDPGGHRSGRNHLLGAGLGHKREDLVGNHRRRVGGFGDGGASTQRRITAPGLAVLEQVPPQLSQPLLSLDLGPVVSAWYRGCNRRSYGDGGERRRSFAPGRSGCSRPAHPEKGTGKGQREAQTSMVGPAKAEVRTCGHDPLRITRNA
jgi:hypothetical protein